MPIGVYDTGVGGLTVYKALSASFPGLDMIYLGDCARVPYGNKSPKTIVKYSIECAGYLASKYCLSAFVVACNTVSSHALPALRKSLGIPVLGVIKPGAAHAADITKNKKIAVLGTHATVNSHAYVTEIKSLPKGKDAEIFQQACPLFVPLAEEAIISGEMAQTVVRETLKDISRKGADTVILGCTHYPILKPLISEVFPEAAIVDSTEYIVKDIKNLGINLTEKGRRQIYVTDESHALGAIRKALAGDANVEVINIFK